MSKRDPLRTLSKKLPPPPELAAALENIYDQPDRSAAIVGSAIIEALLENIIIKQLRCKDPGLIGQLFNNRGPLSDFHSKILVATAIGMITPQVGDELHRIKAIRNVFAHAKADVTFETPEIAAEIDEFMLYKVMIATMEKMGNKLHFTNKKRYLFTIHLLSAMMNDVHKEVTGESLLA